MDRTVRVLRLWLGTAFRAAPVLIGLLCLLVAVQSVTSPMQTYGVKLLVDGLTGTENSAIGWGIGVIVAGFAVSFVSMVLTDPMRDTAQERVARQVHADLLDVTTGVPGIMHHERSDFADRLELIRERSWRLGVGAEILLFAVATLANTATVLTLLASVHPLLLVLPLLGSARIWSAYVSGRMEQEAWEETMQQERLTDRLADIAKDPRSGLELRVFGLNSVLVDRIIKLQNDRYRVLFGATKRGGLIDGTVRLGFAAAYIAAVIWVVWRARQGQASAGDVVLLLLIAPQIDQMTGGIAQNVYWVGEVIRSFARYDWLREYAKEHAWDETSAPAPKRLTSGIVLRDVGFAYPGSDKPVLSHVNLSLPAGSTVALVGENGAGKTTLVKLLARLYDPTEGAVLVDGVDLRAIPPGEWRQRMSASFQDFTKFEFTVRESVGIGDLARMDDEETVGTALRRGGAVGVVRDLPNGLDTQLGKRFSEGVEVSGGQWQRLALARAFMRDEPLLLLLDEPTAALDPAAEHALFEQFAAAAKVAAARTGGLTVLVSHRFSTVRMADLIVVMEDGQITETGAHEDLVGSGGRYAELFELQARAYR
ncbi:ABC transporter ATP-binding protein [Actinopolymorpha sp. B9G3]|uniref:ABC transporter ATP-binding protein n=1 Tax=Actinopolymorpha sp. B9G3 TaxID=3158970 RepID=UPI0032D9432D